MKAITLLSISLLWLMSCSPSKNPESMEVPRAKKHPKELIKHGHSRVDPWYWLNERDNPEVIAYLEAENAYTEHVFKRTGNLRENLYTEMISRIQQTDMSVPYQKNGYEYFQKFEEGQEYQRFYRRKLVEASNEELILDIPSLAEGFSYYQVNGLSVSPDNRYLAYGVDTVSRRQYVIMVKDLITGELLPERIPNTSSNAAWASDGLTFFYAVKDETLRSYMIKRHSLGTSPDEDAIVYEEKDPTFYVSVYPSRTRDFIFIHASSTVSTEFLYLDANKPFEGFKVFEPRRRDHEYFIDYANGSFFIRTNMNARNFRLMKSVKNQTHSKFWEEVIPGRENVLLEGFLLFKDYLVLSERMNGLEQICVKPWKSGEPHYLDFGEETYVAFPGTNEVFDSKVLRYDYNSLTTPNSTFDYDMENRSKILLKQQEVLGDFDPMHYHAERIYATTDDGIKVPISLVYRKGMLMNGSNPCLLYGYGSYGYSSDPYFSSARLSLLDRGFIFAIAHIRGGEEMGRFWYEDGKLLKKKNTFTDFIRCGEYLIEQQYTSTSHLYAMGGSAGGLLVGAVINMRPDLFQGAIAAVPFVDVVTTMLDESIPLTTAEYDEWGNPNDKAYYDYMLSYSPYDQVEAKAYPALLVTTGLHDSQVQYWEPAKWVAKLRDLKTDDNILLLYTDMETGHGGASGRFKRYHETAREFTFLLMLENILK